MSGKNKASKTNRRACKSKGERVIKEKFQEERDLSAKPIVAKTENQKLFLKGCATKSIVVGKGSAGTGKSFLAACVAANKLLKGEIDQIVLARPYVPMGRTTGFWPGTADEKLTPFLAPLLNILKDRLGTAHFNNLYGTSIKIQPMEALRGMSFDNTLLIVDESQNTTKEEIRCIVTRIAEGSQFILIGDDKQSDLRAEDSGISYLVNLIEKHNIEDTAVIEFTSEDIVRHGLVAQFVKIFEEEGSLRK